MTINVLEIRDYTIHPHRRDHFIDNFEAHFMAFHEGLGMSVLGQFRPVDQPDHYVWLRGFSDMETRAAAQNYFYTSPLWKKFRVFTNSMLIDTDTVHLLRPLSPTDLTCGLTVDQMNAEFEAGTISPENGMVMIDYYYALPGQRDALIAAFQKQILTAYQKAGIDVRGLFVAEMSENTYPRLPVIQNPDEFVVISVYASEEACHAQRDPLEGLTQAALGGFLANEVHSVLYPTLRSALRYVTK